MMLQLLQIFMSHLRQTAWSNK